VNICGEGETFLPPETVGIIHSILKEGHYVMVVTNGTVTKRFDEISRLPHNLLVRLLFKFSFHYLELKRKKLLSVFFKNVKKIRDVGCSISLELTPCDEMIPYVDDAISLCKAQVGAICHVTVARDERNPSLSILTQHTRGEYEEIWNRFQSDLFKFKMLVFGEKRREYCYAGLWSAVLDLVTGNLRQCYREEMLQNVFEDIRRPIKFKPVGCHCSQPHCYNAHVFMTLGVIPSIRTPKFAEMRNRLLDDGSEWLTPNMKAFLNRELSDKNVKLTWSEKLFYEIRRLCKASQIIRNAKALFSPHAQ
jgi:hypothetical protein